MKTNKELKDKVEECYSIAEAARKRGNDPENKPEIYMAEGVASRVEGLVGPEGVAKRLKALKKDHSDLEICLLIAKEIAEGKFGHEGDDALDSAIRTGLAYLTQGVVAAPLEGIASVKIEKNTDGTNYLSLFFSGPIRSAGGTAQALTVLIADYVRMISGLHPYKPLDEEIDRYWEEVQLYNRFVRLQYMPTEEQVRTVIENCPICINGEPTEKREVSTNRNLTRVPTNRLRGGAALVISEGIIQKSPKLLKRLKKLKKFNFEWGWVESLIRKESKASVGLPKPKYMNEVPAGRPVFAEPATPGGFRLRYGRGRLNGFAAISLHPATLAIMNDFIAIGTQLRIERPGKATVITPCDTIDGPIVRLKNGEVLQLNSTKEANKYNDQIEEILFLGDILIAYGDFLQNNHPLLPAGYCEEWWASESKNKTLEPYRAKPYKTPSVDLALAAAKKEYLHPKYTFFWSDLTFEELIQLHKFVLAADGNLLDEDAKPILEKLGVFHKIDNGLLVDKDHWAVLTALLKNDSKISGTDVLVALSEFSGIKLRHKAPTYIGARMGRPEKIAMRKMSPAPHVLFPTGITEGRIRELNKAIDKELKTYPQIARFECPNCGPSPYRICLKCGKEGKLLNTCPKCGATGPEICPACNIPTNQYMKREIDLASYLEHAQENIGEAPAAIKGIMGMSSRAKIPEPLEKGILRAKHDLYVFKDGTIRVDSTDLGITHFRPKEILTSVNQLKKLGYTKDIDGKPLTKDDQLLVLKPQDIFLSTNGDDSSVDVFIRVTKFIDDLLVKYYKLDPYYNVETKEDLIGHIILGLAPHTSAAVVGRIIGFSDVRGGYAHPYFHAAKRRNLDGDEDALMLLMDALLNFSGSFLPSTRGGTMDAPLVLTTILDPNEVDDEVYDMEVVDSYPLDFYLAALNGAHPSEVSSMVKRVSDMLEDVESWKFTHDTADFNEGPKRNRYTSGEMLEKLADQLELAKKIRAIDENLVASLVLRSHFIPDMKGNLRTFSNQKFRCVKCNTKYRRVPLVGKCTRCGHKLLLTVSKGSVVKYLEASKELIRKYEIPEYFCQQVMLLDKQMDSILGKDPHTQKKLTSF
ncbi:DNA polymerase II large subunit [Candidatus Undinarchaeota archaeon]